MRRGLAPWVILLVLMLAGRSGAEHPLRLTMDDAVARALSANVGLQASRKDVDIADASLERSSAWFPSNPQLSVGSQAGFETTLAPNYGITLSQELEIAGQRSQRIMAAKHGIEKASWDSKNEERNLTGTVKAGFIRALVNADRLTLARRGLDAVEQLTTEFARRETSSETEQIQFNQMQMQKSRTVSDVASAEQALEDSLDLLRYLLDLPADQPLELVGAAVTRVKELPGRSELVQRALDRRADLLALRRGAERADAQIDLIRSEAIPNVTLSGTVTRFEGTTFGGGDIAGYLPVWRRQKGETLEALAERQRSLLQVRDSQRLVELEVLQAWRAAKVKGADLERFQSVILPKSDENLSLERRLYERRRVTAADLIEIQVDDLSVRREYLDAIEAYNEALIELERSTGGPLEK